MVDKFEERQKAFEKKFEHDQDLLFRVLSRRARLAGLWAAEHLGLTGTEAEAYARDIVQVDLEEPGHQDVVRRLRKDFDEKGIDISNHRIEKELERLLDLATQQVKNA